MGGGEPPAELAHRQVGVPGEVPDAGRLAEPGKRVGDRAADGVIGGGGRHRPLDELGLPAVPVRRDDHAPRDPVGDAGAVIGADEVEAGVDPGCRSRRGDDLAVVHVQDARVDPDAREPGLEQPGVTPVRGGAQPVQQPGRREHERARADR
ncbi:MAG TPA: hypothetical protein VMV17_23260, partial [Streptosporangiaceae bacterium]|nr:hypothetical protein [Streptosporangiaceae bacterium]